MDKDNANSQNVGSCLPAEEKYTYSIKLSFGEYSSLIPDGKILLEDAGVAVVDGFWAARSFFRNCKMDPHILPTLTKEITSLSYTVLPDERWTMSPSSYEFDHE